VRRVDPPAREDTGAAWSESPLFATRKSAKVPPVVEATLAVFRMTA
jgi:hypothetical protein